MHGGGSPDGARLFIHAFSRMEDKVNMAQRLAGIKEDIPEPSKKK
jgi:4-hydroxybutyryl-CoA dehydratase/vinylacetyl-CoA-Delta-isomerase